jgi:DICT domain-containing protein
VTRHEPAASAAGTAAQPGGGDPAVLTIGEVSARTGIPVAGLRNWEQRYGLPRPERTSSGQRRYRESDCGLLAEVLAARDRGLSMPAAVALAVAQNGQAEPASIFASLRSQHPGLRVHVLSKSVLLALTRAIEDECCARAQRPVLLASFQRQGFYQASRARYDDLAHGAEQTVVYADFEQVRHRPGPLAEIPVPPGSPMRREWSLICDSQDQPGCVTGWERPGQGYLADKDRIFEAMWSVDPRVVRGAARLGASLAQPAAPEVAARLRARLSDEPSPSSADLRRASGLLERTLDYLAG